MGLDLSYKTGWAVMDGPALLSFGQIIVPEQPPQEGLVFDYAQLDRAKLAADRIASLVRQYSPDKIFIEQTNLGKNRIDQKGLEWIHCSLLECLRVDFGTKISYVDTSQWRSILQIKLSKEQRDHNKLVKQEKARGKITSKHLAVYKVNEKFDLQLKIKDNDKADAICLAWYGYEKTSAVFVSNADKALEDLL